MQSICLVIKYACVNLNDFEEFVLWIDLRKIKYCLCQLYSSSGHPQEKLSLED